MNTLPLLYCLIGTVGVSWLASIWVRASAEELDDETRGRVARAADKTAWIWQGLEWIGIALLLAGMFLPTRMLFTAASQRIITIAVGLELFCFANASATWAVRTAYAREAPTTRAARSAYWAAVMVSIAEVALLCVVVWIVMNRIDWKSDATSNESSTTESSKHDPAEKDVWIDEQLAKQDLSHLDPDYVQGLVESGALHTKNVGGKKLYRQRDVEILKKRKKENIP
ncbi:MAG: hypothetical protein WCT04_05200 [Planctomycetota bacterium]